MYEGVVAPWRHEPANEPAAAQGQVSQRPWTRNLQALHEQTSNHYPTMPMSTLHSTTTEHVSNNTEESDDRHQGLATHHSQHQLPSTKLIHVSH